MRDALLTGWVKTVARGQFKTPPIPRWIRGISHPLYRNIFTFELGNANLWGTETLLGDWDAEHLLIAKDFYPAQYIEEAVRVGVANPYRHNPEAPTNKNLLKTLSHFGRVQATFDSAECNFLYISACFLLRNDGLKRGPLPDARTALSLSAPVVRFTMNGMPNLRKVIAMGSDAEGSLLESGILNEVKSRKLSYFKVSHPSRALSDADRFAEWSPVFSKAKR